MKLNWNFLGEGGRKTKKPSIGGVQIFSGTAQWVQNFLITKQQQRCQQYKKKIMQSFI